MPKPIKKKTEKKSRIEEDGMNYVDSVRGVYERNQQIIQKAVLVLIALVIVIAAVFFYVKRTTSKVSDLNYEGYKAYTQAIATNDNALLNQALDKFKKSYAVKKSAFSLYYQADILLRTGDAEGAIKSLTTLTTSFSSDNVVVPLAYAKLGTLHISMNDSEKALKTFQEMEKRDLPFYGDLALYEEANILKKLGNNEEAKEAEKLLVERYPYSPYTEEVKPRLEAEEKKDAAAEVSEKNKGEGEDSPAK